MLQVLFEDNHLLVVNKPAMMPTMGVPASRTSLIDVAKAYVKQRYNKPGNVYLGVVSRLDVPVTGVVVIARTSKAASRLTNQFRERSVKKEYWAMVPGNVRPRDGDCLDWVIKHERHRKVMISHRDQPGAQEAKLRYETLRTIPDKNGPVSLLRIALLTGRKHQIRVQLSHRGHAIIGDRKYGSVQSFAQGIALHARSVRLKHPTKQHEIEFVAPLPRSWKGFGELDE